MNSNLNYNVSVVIPVYRSQDSLKELTRQLSIALPRICTSFEVIYVVDGSPDASWSMVKTMANQYSWIQGIKLMKNFGQDNAILAGMRAAKFPIIVTMDDDLQHPPSEISKLLDKFSEGFDVVFGTASEPTHNAIRRTVTKITKRILASIIGSRSLRDMSAFRIFKTKLRDASAGFNSPHVNIDVLLSWGTNNFSSTEVVINKRTIGKSNYSIKKLTEAAMLILTGFSTAPLRLATITGIFMGLIGIAILIYVMVEYFTNGSVPGFPFLASIIALFSGVQLFTLGILGEYLGQIFTRSMDRPPYVIEERL